VWCEFSYESPEDIDGVSPTTYGRKAGLIPVDAVTLKVARAAVGALAHPSG